VQAQRRISEEDERPSRVAVLGGGFGLEDRVADGRGAAEDLAKLI